MIEIIKEIILDLKFIKEPKLDKLINKWEIRLEIAKKKWKLNYLGRKNQTMVKDIEQNLLSNTTQHS